jgi:proline iminopeptidase
MRFSGRMEIMALVAGFGLLAGSAHAASGQVSLAQAKAIIATRETIVSPHGIQQQLLIPIDGTKQWISIRGNDLRNPILLVRTRRT